MLIIIFMNKLLGYIYNIINRKRNKYEIMK